MKNKLQNFLKHKLQWLLLLAALLGVSQGVWGSNGGTIYLTTTSTNEPFLYAWGDSECFGSWRGSSFSNGGATVLGSGGFYSKDVPSGNYHCIINSNDGQCSDIDVDSNIWGIYNGSNTFSQKMTASNMSTSGICKFASGGLSGRSTKLTATWDGTEGKFVLSNASWTTGDGIDVYLDDTKFLYVSGPSSQPTGTYNIKWNPYDGTFTFAASCTPPTVTANDASSVTSSSAVLSGSYSGGTGIGAKTFTITPSAGVSIGAVSCSGGTCTATATGLTVGTSYSYTFNVVNDCGTTSSSSSSSFIPKNSITIKISKKEPAFTPNKIYIWYNDGSDHTISGAWPGDEFDSSDENWYIKNIDVPYGSVKFIANYGSNQTSDTNISSISDDETYCYKIENNNGYKATVIDCETCDDLSTSNYTLTGSLTQTWDGSAKSVSIAAKTGYPSGTTYYTGTDGTSYSKNSSAPSAPGKYTITYEVAASSPYCAANLNFGTLIIQRSVTIRVEKPMGGDFLNSQTPQVYYWYHDGHDDYVLSASWPGDAFDSDDDDWYYKDINVPYPGLRIIVNNNNNGHQTKDIEIADITSATNYCYEIPGTKDGDKYNYNEVSCCTPPTASGFTMSPTSVTYDGNSHAVTVSPEPGYGAVSDIKYNGSSTAPTNVGEYTITADIAAEGDWCAVDDLEIGTFSITKRSQAALSITTSTENRCTGVLPLQLAVSGGSTSGVVTYAETAHTGTVSVSSSGEITASTDASITVTATMAGDATYDDVVSDPVTFTFTQSHVIYLKGSGAGGASATYPWEYMTIEVDRSSGKTTPSDLTVEFIETPDFSGGVAPNHSVTITDDNKYLLKSAKTVNDAHYYTVKAQDVSGGTCAASDASYNVYINSAPAEMCGE